MSDEREQNDSAGDSEVELDEVEIDIDADAIDEETGEHTIDQAMREALDAVEQIQTQSDSAGGIAAVPTLDGAGDDVEALQAEIADLKDRSVRTLADFDNYRKRIERERQDERRYASSDVLRDFLGVVDNMERALEAGGSVEDLKAGVEMTLRQVRELLRTRGVQAVEAVGAKFDPAVHDAVSQVESSEVDVPMVDSVLQGGYVLHERLLRPAMVVVAMPTASAAAPPAEGSANPDSDPGVGSENGDEG